MKKRPDMESIHRPGTILYESEQFCNHCQNGEMRRIEPVAEPPGQMQIGPKRQAGEHSGRNGKDAHGEFMPEKDMAIAG